MSGAVQDVITPASFGEDRLKGFGVARGLSSKRNILRDSA